MATQSAHTWSKPVITDRGLVLRQKAIDNKLDLKFTKAQVGTGKPSDPNEIGKMTALVTPQKLAKVMRSFADDKGMFTQTVRVENTGYQSSIPVTEIGVFATIVGTGEEVLYSYIYCLSGAVVIPPASEHYYSHDIQLNTGVSLTDNVTLVYDGTGVFVDFDELDEHNKSSQSHPNKVNGNWTIVKSMQEIGLENKSYPVAEVVKAMAIYTTLILHTNKVSTAHYPVEAGLLTIHKLHNSRCELWYQDINGLNLWKGVYSQQDDKFLGWKHISKDEPPKWIKPTVAAGITQSRQVQYCKNGNLVTIEGWVVGVSPKKTIFTLPVGYRPADSHEAIVASRTIANDNSESARININGNTGIVTIFHSTNTQKLAEGVSLDCTFVASR